MDVDIRIMKARSQLYRDHSFFGTLAMRLRVVERDDIPTMATDGTFLFYAKRFLDAMSEAVILFTVAHEVLHCVLGHHTRRGSRDPLRWNIACDYVVNLLLHKAGFKVPEWAYFDERFDGMGAEEVYRILEHEEKQQEQQQQQQASDEPSDEDGPQRSSGQPSDEDDDPNDNDDYDGCDDDDQEDSGDDQCDSDSGDGSSGTSKDGTAGQGNGGSTQTAPQDGSDPSESSDGTSSPSPTNGNTQPGSSSGAGTSPTSQDGTAGPPSNGSGSPDQLAGDEVSGSADGTSTQPTTDSKYPRSYGDPGGCGEVLDAAPPYDEAANAKAADDWQTYTRQAANILRRAGEGKLPGFAEEIVEQLDDPRIDWRDVLHRFVDPMTSTTDNTWAMPNRRYYVMGYMAPGVISDGINHVAIAIDSSISVDMAWLRKFGGEAQAAFDNGGIDKITVIFADTQVHKAETYVKGEQIDWTVLGRGGTAFSPTFAWINENEPGVSAVIYFTDLECSDFGPEPPYPVLWAAYGANPQVTAAYMAKVPFGECIELQD